GGLGNSGDYVVLLDGSWTLVDGLSYGTLGTDPALAVHLSSVGANTAAWFTGGSTADINATAYWRTGSESGGASTPRAPNGGANTAWVNSLLPRPAIAVNPTSHSFGSVVVGQEGPPLTVTVQNVGCANLLVGTASLTGANLGEFEIRSDSVSGQTIPAGGSRTLQVVFKPTSTGAKAATLRIPSSDPQNPVVTVALSGTGVAPQISVTPLAHDFGAVLVGQESSSLTVTVSNEGSAPLSVGLVTLGGTHPGEFAIRNDGVSQQTIPVGESRTLQVVFKPTSVGGKSASVAIPSNDQANPVVNVPLSGTGQAALSVSAGGPYSGVAGVPVTLAATATGGFPPYTFAWDLDADGGYDDATGAEVHRTWTLPGTYAVAVRATDSAGAQATDATTVRIYPAKGDVNGDGRIDLVDLRLAHQAALGLIVLSPEERGRADINGNGIVDLEDVTLLCRMILGGCG
ncbi:MAG: choice-of-anchor D domain-containing protein, partial [Candidatus Bipolaricaulota bacterium]|nr:choice-of-anchor D domain-containing protein [Candidatus Bipolaricaulota bacterium]